MPASEWASLYLFPALLFCVAVDEYVVWQLVTICSVAVGDKKIWP